MSYERISPCVDLILTSGFTDWKRQMQNSIPLVLRFSSNLESVADTEERKNEKLEKLNELKIFRRKWRNRKLNEDFHQICLVCGRSTEVKNRYDDCILRKGINIWPFLPQKGLRETTFSVLHWMQCRAVFAMSEMSVRLLNACIVTKRKKLVPIFIYRSFTTRRMVGGGDPFYLKFWVKVTP